MVYLFDKKERQCYTPIATLGTAWLVITAWSRHCRHNENASEGENKYKTWFTQLIFPLLFSIGKYLQFVWNVLLIIITNVQLFSKIYWIILPPRISLKFFYTSNYSLKFWVLFVNKLHIWNHGSSAHARYSNLSGHSEDLRSF